MPSLSMAKAYFALCFVFFSGLVTANDPSTCTQQKCSTRFAGSKPASIRTTIQAVTLTFTIPALATVTPTQTVTPLSATATAVTTLRTIVTEVQTQATNIFTITSTQTNYVTVPALALTTQFTTSQSIVAVASTTNIAPPSGFTALGDQLQAAGNTYAKRDEERRHPRDILATLDARAAQPVCTSIRFGPNGPTPYPQAYPATVQCNKLLEVVKTSTKLFTAKPTTVTAAQGTITLTSTATITDTTTLSPIAASTTIFESASTIVTTTSNSTSTIISTLTSITTSFAPQATYYAACAPNNLVSRINGNGISAIGFPTGLALSEFVTTAANSAYDCCALCLSSSTCAGAAYFPNTAPRACELLSPSDGGISRVSTENGGAGTLSNGYRAYFVYQQDGS